LSDLGLGLGWRNRLRLCLDDLRLHLGRLCMCLDGLGLRLNDRLGLGMHRR
jgi:hypothetical protein